jgi:hypothetical protein
MPQTRSLAIVQASFPKLPEWLEFKLGDDLILVQPSAARQ